MNFKDLKNERNQKIVDLYNSGKDWDYIAETLNITKACAKNAYQRYSKKIEPYEGFEKILYDSCIRNGINFNNGAIVRISNCLKSIGVYDDVKKNPYILFKYSDKDLLSIKNFGKQCLDIVRGIDLSDYQ